MLLICCVVVIAPRFIHTDLFKQNLETLLSRKLSREVRITGDLTFRFFPWIGFKAKGLHVANADGFGHTAMVTSAMVDIHLELFPLLKKRMVFKEIVLVGTKGPFHSKPSWKDQLGRFSLHRPGLSTKD